VNEKRAWLMVNELLGGEPLVLFVATVGGGKPEDRDVYAGV